MQEWHGEERRSSHTDCAVHIAQVEATARLAEEMRAFRTLIDTEVFGEQGLLTREAEMRGKMKVLTWAASFFLPGLGVVAAAAFAMYMQVQSSEKSLRVVAENQKAVIAALGGHLADTKTQALHDFLVGTQNAGMGVGR